MKTPLLIILGTINGFMAGLVYNSNKSATPLELKLPLIIQMIEEEREYALKLCFSSKEVKWQEEFCGGYQAADVILHNMRGILYAD
jgi:hypothetical protein